MGPWFEAYFYAAAVIVTCAANVLFTRPYLLSQVQMTLKLSVAMGSMFYRKALRLSPSVLGGSTAGQAVTMLSNDLEHMELMFVHYLWVGPVETLLLTYFMYSEIGIAAVIGVVILLVSIPFHTYLGRKTSELRLKTALRTDERVQLMVEIINGIQVIKMYAWEKPFGKLVELARK